MARELIGLREYARRRGVSLAAVQKAIKAGRITTVDGKIDQEVADIQWGRNTDPALAKPPAKSAPPQDADVQDEPGEEEGAPAGYFASKARREAALAETAELDLAVKRGELVRVEDVERRLVTRIIGAREALDSIADRLSPVLASEADAAVIHRTLRAEIRQVMSSLAGNEEPVPAAEEVQA